ncbi:MAG TPA: cytochrome c3 family protein [Propionibacteriaceae bacterium]
MTVKKITILLVLALAVLTVMLVPAVALAVMGPHGGYLSDTDACAECHRAHTAPSSVTWTDNQGGQKNALLLTGAGSMADFCLACHDNTSQGADTNVLDGMYEGTLYGAQNTSTTAGPFGRPNPSLTPGRLYANGVTAVTSTHLTYGESWGAYGGGTFGKTSTQTVDANGDVVGLQPGGGSPIVMTCSSCHDPHGSSNYRILKDVVYGVAVGGYSGGTAQNPDPQPFVISKERGFPQEGFRLHTQYSAYFPNYTTPKYSIAPAANPLKGMSGWCTGCHTTYMSKESTYNAGDGFGLVTRHRHPINVPMSNNAGPSALVTDSVLPLAHVEGASGGVGTGVVANTDQDWIDCLTCHNAHGTTKVMTGWANVANVLDPVPDSGKTFGGGVAPTADSALLKLDNRGVCETCHNK